MKKLSLFLTLLIGVCVGTHSYAQSIFTNPITDTNPSASNPYTNGQTVTANLTVSGIGRGSGITGNAGSDRYNAANWNTAGSIDLTDYFEFTLTPAGGYSIYFTSFVYTGQRSGTGPNTFEFRSSLDGYTASIGSPTSGGTTISLSAGTYQNISSAITFRFYGYGASGGAGTFSINDFTFNGRVCQPGYFTTTGSWGTASNWCDGAVPNATAVNITTGTTATVSSAVNPVTDLTIPSGATVVIDAGQSLTVTGNLSNAGTITNNGTLNIAGSITNTGTFTTSSSTATVVLNGGAAQTIPVGAFASNNVNNLTLNNAAGATITAGGTVNILGTYTPASGTLTTNGGLVLKSTSLANTARVAAGATGGGYFTGNVMVERFIPGRRAFRFLAHPFSASLALTELTDDIDITGDGGAAPFTTTSTNSPSAFYFNVAASDNSTTGVNPGWTAYVTADVWGVNQAMRVLVRGAKTEGLTNGAYTPSNVTIDMTGALTQGDQTLTLTHGTGDFVLVANPFASQVNMDAVTHSNINANYYVWNAQGGTRGIYQTETRGTTGYILPSCASYVAVFTAGGNGSAAFEEADKSSTTPGAMLKTTAIANMVKLDITDSTTYWDGFRIHFDNAAMSTKENSDARKLYNPETNFYSFSKDDSTLAVDVRPYTDGEVIPMGFTTPYTKSFKIVASSFDMPAGTKLFLTDKYLNKTTEITAGFEYAFTVTADSASQGNKRFELNAQGKLVTTGISTETANKLKVKLVPNPTTNNVTIYYEGAGKELNIVVTNMIGVKVAEATQSNTNGSVTIPMQNAAAGMYIVTIKNGNETLTQKLIKQ